MPEILSTTIKPKSYLVTIAMSNTVFEFEGPRMTDAYTDSQGPDGRVQILDYGVALWGPDRTRTVYPWHTVLQIEEMFR